MTPDPFLTQAHRQWLPLLEEGKILLHEGEAQRATEPLSRAITESARYHPLFHFLESGLNTELAIRYHRAGALPEAQSCFTRAQFLHHDNATALAALAQGMEPLAVKNLPAYPLAKLIAPLPPAQEAGERCIRHLRGQARRTGDDREAIALYLHAIELCETTHLAYHRLAAEPWLWRAKAFDRQGETALARNDAIRGLDLDKANLDLAAMAAKPLR